MKNLGTPKQKIELVYGDRLMPAHIPGQGWQMLPNKLKARPLYVGMANPMNLMTDPAKPLGGWELIQLRKP